MKSDLIIRADGSNEIGLGHLVRCLSLSAILKNQFRIRFVCRQIPQKIESELVQQGFLLHRIDFEEQFFDLLRGRETVVLDGYTFGPDYQKKVRSKAFSLAFIDDLHDREYFADLILNHAPGISKDQYSAQPYTAFALGLDYALLRPPFIHAALESNPREKASPENVLICFGGSDSKNLTLRALNVISDLNQFKKIIIITGSAYQFEKELMQNIKNTKNVEYHHALTGEKMAGVFMKSDVAIVPSSGILFEALATCNIAVSGTYTDNQKEVYAGFKKLNAIIDAGEFAENQIRNAIQLIPSYTVQKKLIDGKSPQRIRKLFDTIKKD